MGDWVVKRSVLAGERILARAAGGGVEGHDGIRDAIKRAVEDAAHGA